MTLERIEHKVFASEAPLDEMGQFGSALATTKLNTKDVAEIQALPAYTKGWGSAIISENNYPAMEEMNGVLNVMSYHTGYLYQEGIPTYSATQEYSVTSWVKDLAGEKVYKSLQGGNKGHDLTDPAWWVELKLGGGGGLEIGDIGFTQMAIDESKGKRRVLNGQVIIQDQYVQFTNIIKNSVALNPSIACTEAEWQTEVIMNTFGLCGKFVIDDEGGTIRLPKYPNYFIAGLANIAPVVGNGIAPVFSDGTNERVLNCYQYGASWGYRPTNGKVGSASAQQNGVTNVAYGFSTDPTKSGIEAQINEKQIAGQYFIQVATGAETEDNIINEIELNNPFSLLDYKYSEYELNNISWLRSNGQYNSKAIYPAVYDLLLKIYNGVETKAGVSVKLSTETFTDYDFVLNTAEETFRLPLLNGSEDLVSSKYDVLTVEASGASFVAPANGWLYLTGKTTGSSAYLSVDIPNTFCGINGEANKDLTLNQIKIEKGQSFTIRYNNLQIGISKFIYAQGNGSLYYYVGETVQNANLINAGRIEEKIVDKVDYANTQWATNACMPDYSAGVNISSFPFTAFCAGTIALSAHKADVGSQYFYINDVKIAGQYNSSNNYYTNIGGEFLINKGDVLTKDGAWTIDVCVFFPLKGAK